MTRLALLALLSLALPRAAGARAGGGGSFHSSGGSSYSGSSSYSGHSSYSGGSGYSSPSGSSSAPATPMTRDDFIATVIFGLLLLAVAGAVVGLAVLYDRWRTSRAAGLPLGVPRAVIQSSLAALKARDPAFELQPFLDRSPAVFRKVQEAWSAGDMTPVCHLLSDGVFERFSLLLDLDCRAGRANRVDGLRLDSVELARAGSGPRYDVLDVAVSASCRDRYVSTADGSTISEDDSAFREVWSFVRSAGARTREGRGAVERLCPNCGAPFEVNRAAACPSCRAWVNSGEFDWVLAEITQADVWRPTPRPDGLLSAFADDPETTTEGLEDRGSLLFWLWLRCLTDGKPDALEGWCSPEGLADVAASGVGRLRFEDCGVGSVDVETAESAGGTDRVSLVAVWDGHEAAYAGETERRHRRCRTSITLVRKTGARAVANSGLRSGHCAGCGAPVPAGKPACEHCGRGFKDPAVDWVVAGLQTMGA